MVMNVSRLNIILILVVVVIWSYGYYSNQEKTVITAPMSMTPTITSTKIQEASVNATLLITVLPTVTSIPNIELSKDEIIKNIKLNSIASGSNDVKTVKSVLARTDINILKKIKEINIVDDITDCGLYDAIGCTRGNDELGYTVDLTYAYYERNQIYECSSFEWTINHEIGHVKGGDKDNSEEYAENYARENTQDSNIRGCYHAK